MKRNTVERPIKTEMTQAQNEKEWASSVGLCPKHNPQKETFIKRYIVERTNKEDIRPGEQSEKPESCREDL